MKEYQFSVVADVKSYVYADTAVDACKQFADSLKHTNHTSLKVTQYNINDIKAILTDERPKEYICEVEALVIGFVYANDKTEAFYKFATRLDKSEGDNINASSYYYQDIVLEENGDNIYCCI